MSLLMKALEKAAKDRADAQLEPAAATGVAATAGNAAPSAELTLEPLTGGPSPGKPRSEPQLKAGRGAGTLETTWNEHDRAATVIRAGTPGKGGVASYVQGHPIVILAALATIFLLGFGIYVYLQITKPGLFIAKVPPAVKPPAPVVQVPAAPSPPEPVVEQALPAAQLLQPNPELAVQPPASPAPPLRSPEAPQAIKPSPTPPQNRIVIKRGNAQPAVSPLLNDAYAALNSGRLDTSRRLYGQVLRNDPRSIDALLGLSAIAARENKTDEAAKHYLRILELDPRHALAQAGLIAILGRADPLAAETRLKLLIAREPSSFLYFTLGNLYADQLLWAQAQQAYFQAYHLEPANPDYAYNLAVGLEHLNQSRLALGFYRRAVQLASTSSSINFSLAQAQERIARLASRVE